MQPKKKKSKDWSQKNKHPKPENDEKQEQHKKDNNELQSLTPPIKKKIDPSKRKFNLNNF